MKMDGLYPAAFRNLESILLMGLHNLPRLDSPATYTHRYVFDIIIAIEEITKRVNQNE
jgi:hypothetical protein